MSAPNMFAKNTIEFIDYLNTFQSRDLIELQCPNCFNFFHRSKHDIQSKFGKANNRQSIYCSRKCLFISMKTIESVQCAQCGFKFDKYPNQIKKTTNNFCSSSCAAIYNNTHKTNGIRRSKLEKWIEGQLETTFSNLAIKFNDIKTIDLELDIYIPDLKLAFELNGIFHYKPIYKNYLKTINNDQKKIQRCVDKGINLVVIDVSEQGKFTEQSSRKYLNYIIDNIKLADIVQK